MTQPTITRNQTLAGNNGVETATLDFTGMKSGEYQITARYQENNRYNESTDTINVNVDLPPVSIPCTTTTSWIRNNERTTTSAILDDDGYITSVREGNTDYFTAHNSYPFERNMTLEVDMIRTAGSMYGWGPIKIESNTGTKFFVFTNGSTANIEEKHSGGNSANLRINALPQSTLVSMKYIVDNDGYITYTDSTGANQRSSYPFSDSELEVMQFGWKNWSNDKTFSVHRYEIKK